MRHEMLTQSTFFAITCNTKRYAESAFRDACRTSSDFPLLALYSDHYSRAASIILYTIVYCLAASILIMSCSKVLFLVVS